MFALTKTDYVLGDIQSNLGFLTNIIDMHDIDACLLAVAMFKKQKCHSVNA